MRTLMKAGFIALAAAGIQVPVVGYAQDSARDSVSIERLSGEIELLRKDNAVLKSRLATAEETLSTFSTQIGKVDDATRRDMETLRGSVAGHLDKADAQRAEIDSFKTLVNTLTAEIASTKAELAATRDQLKQIEVVGGNAQAAHVAVAEMSNRMATMSGTVASLKTELVAEIKASEVAMTSKMDGAVKATQDALRMELAVAVKGQEDATQVALNGQRQMLEETRSEVATLARAASAADAQRSATAETSRNDLNGALAAIKTLTAQMDEQVASRKELERTVEKAVEQVKPKVEEMIAGRIDLAARRAVNDVVAADLKKNGYPAVAAGSRADALDAGALARLTSANSGKKPPADDVIRAPFDVVLSFTDNGTADRMKKFLSANGVRATQERSTDGAPVLMVGRFYEFDAATAHRSDISKRFGLHASIVDRVGHVH